MNKDLQLNLYNQIIKVVEDKMGIPVDKTENILINKWCDSLVKELMEAISKDMVISSSKEK